MKNLAQYLLYFMKYDLLKFATPLQQLAFAHIWPFLNKHFSNYKNCGKLILGILTNFLARLKRSIKADPTQLMSKLAKRYNINHKTISRAFNEYLGTNSYMKCCNLLTACSRAVRVERCPKLLNHLKNKGGHVHIFVDEKKFIVGEVANHQNTQVIACYPSEVPPVMQSRNPASVIIFAAVENDGKMIPPHFIKGGLKINTAEYLKIVNDVLLPWIRTNYNGIKVMLVQDSVPAHGAKQVWFYLKENLPLFVPKDIWPSSSPDLNVCNYWLFSVIERQSNINPHPNVNSEGSHSKSIPES